MPDDPQRRRLDVALVERGLVRSRAAARDAIRRGCVNVDGRTATRPSLGVSDDTTIFVDDPASPYVSRAALKLTAALDRFGYGVAGSSALDLGASTGGFTQVLLKRGAAHVTAIDVGHRQMAPTLATDPRVTLREGVNCRNLTAAALAGRAVEAIVCDVSFISLRLALPPALALASPGAWLVAVVKPQFEVGADAIGKGGIVRDRAVGENAAQTIATWLSAEPGWAVDSLFPSPIEGAAGNLEFMLGARKAHGRA